MLSNLWQQSIEIFTWTSSYSCIGMSSYSVIRIRFDIRSIIRSLEIAYRSLRVDLIFSRQRRSELSQRLQRSICRDIDIEISHQRDSHTRCIVPADMSGYDTIASCSSFIDITERIDNKIISNISSSFGKCMIFVDILQLLDSSIFSSSK